MMVETILESSQDFGMSGGALPQWKRELLQRRAARSRPPPPAPPPPPPPPPRDEDEDELRYGPGIVKRLKSRYLSLALRDAPRRRPSVLRRAASLEHLLDERPPPAPRAAPATPRPAARAPRPASALVTAAAAQALPAPRRDAVKRARSVDALSRLEPRDEPPPPPRPAARPPRRPAPLLRDAERPPPDVVRSTLRKFEPAPVRRAAPAARVSAALRGLERGPTPPPESPAPPEPRSPSPGGPDPAAADEAPSPGLRAVTRAALEGIARAGCSTRYAFEAPRRGSHLPPLAATNPVLLGRARRVGVIRPMPAPALERALSAPVPLAEELPDKPEEPLRSPPPRESPPSALVEPIPRSPPEETPARLRSPDPPPIKPDSPVIKPDPPTIKADPPSYKVEVPVIKAEPPTPKIDRPEPKLEKLDKQEKQQDKVEKSPVVVNGVSERGAASWGALRARPPPATTVVFNFSHRKEVPDYIENDGLVLRASRRDRIKPGEPGVVVLRPEALTLTGSDDEADGSDGPPSPCDVRFVNDNVLINGRSSMPKGRDRDRQARLKLQFDDSLTRTFEYPSETSLCIDSDDDCPSAPTAPSNGFSSAPNGGSTAPAAAHHAASTLAANTHIASAALARYTPSKTCADAFQLGVTRRQETVAEKSPGENGDAADGVSANNGETGEGEGMGEGGDARPCAHDAAHCWSDSRTLATDLLF